MTLVLYVVLLFSEGIVCGTHLWGDYRWHCYFRLALNVALIYSGAIYGTVILLLLLLCYIIFRVYSVRHSEDFVLVQSRLPKNMNNE